MASESMFRKASVALAAGAYARCLSELPAASSCLPEADISSPRPDSAGAARGRAFCVPALVTALKQAIP
jgi:hypothetical protein